MQKGRVNAMGVGVNARGRVSSVTLSHSECIYRELRETDSEIKQV